jgi:molecular chaperone DnaK
MNYVGIDLGTTNSAICSYDGKSIRLYKSPEQHDVTPSAIFIDARGKRYVGSRAYNNASRNPERAATLFKRLMGTSTPIVLQGAGLELTPEECSATILRALFGYLPEDFRDGDEVGTVITVPAAFNQMQKDATMAAADAAGIGSVALMQEPVAAVMSVMRGRQSDGVFMVYDLGGGTLDIALAESIAGRVSLLAHGGIAMCGGRDFDRALFDNVIIPWLRSNFRLPADLRGNPAYAGFLRTAMWETERAKIELSQAEDVVVSLPDAGTARDLDGAELYLDVPLTRRQLDGLIEERLLESIRAARDTLTKAGLGPNDLERIVFVGGPTQYRPLREKVAFELGVAASTDVNPMTAVAEGAAVFAESVDWSSKSRGRKSARGSLTSGESRGITFNYVARTPDHRAKLVVQLSGSQIEGAEFQVDSQDTGWSSGRVPLREGATVDLVLASPGENRFKVFVFDAAGVPVKLIGDSIVISRTAASVDAIPASSSIAVEARDKIGGQLVLDYLVRQGESLPKKGTKIFKAEESLRAGGEGAIKFKLWEGEISNPITDNRFIGLFEIRGKDFEEGVIPAGAELVCEYEVLDSGNIVMEVAVRSIGASFRAGRNLYSRQEGQIDYRNAAKLVEEEAEEALKRVDDLSERIDDNRLQQARSRLETARSAAAEGSDPEVSKQAMDDVQEAKRLLSLARQDNLAQIRQLELDSAVDFFKSAVEQYARPSEKTAFTNLTRTAQRAIDNNGTEFETHLSELRSKNFMILWRQDWFVLDRFKWMRENRYMFLDARAFVELVAVGEEALVATDMDRLRQVTAQLEGMRHGASADDQIMAGANIVRS